MGHALTLELPMGLRPGALQLEDYHNEDGVSAAQALSRVLSHLIQADDRPHDDEALGVILTAAVLLYHHGVNGDMEQPTLGQAIRTASVWFYG